MNRREFLRGAIKCVQIGLACALGTEFLSGCIESKRPIATVTAPKSPRPTLTPPPESHRARFFQRLSDGSVRCELCWRCCQVPQGEAGFCRGRKNVNGTYYSLLYERPGAVQVDPIEKEPSYHMLPGSSSLSVGTAGCNNRCMFCHNWHLSQSSPYEVTNLGYTVAEIVGLAQGMGCRSLSFTYNEPTIFYEFMYDIAARAKEVGFRTLFHTNGGMNREPLLALLEMMDAVTVDLKAFTERFYERISASRLAPVLQTLETIRKAGKHLEIVNLVIPTLNDNLDDIRRMCAWIKANLGADVPLHLNRFFPAYRLQRLAPTPVETLEAAAQIADAEGLEYVYIGNMPGHRRNSTFCPRCGTLLIQRVHFSVLEMNLRRGRCPNCEHEIPGIWPDYL